MAEGRRPLLETHSELAAQWHPQKNGPLMPDQVVAGSHQSVWWKCLKGPDHEWQATIHNRVQSGGCPFCRGLRVSITNSLATRSPSLAAEWHPSRNEGLRPEQITAGSGKSVWWKCPKGADHEWLASPNSRTSGNKQGCPF